MWVLTSLPNVNLGAGWTVELSVKKNLPSLSGAWRWSLGMSLSRFLIHQGYCWPCSENCQTVTGIIGWTAPLHLPTVSYSSYLSGATYVSYQGSVYQQVFGTAMLLLFRFKTLKYTALETFPHCVQFWRRHIDNGCCSVHSTLVCPLLLHLNGIEPSIQFTRELEEDGCLPFLDLLLSKPLHPD